MWDEKKPFISVTADDEPRRHDRPTASLSTVSKWKQVESAPENFRDCRTLAVTTISISLVLNTRGRVCGGQHNAWMTIKRVQCCR
jgi:hypothetical protein